MITPPQLAAPLTYGKSWTIESGFSPSRSSALVKEKIARSRSVPPSSIRFHNSLRLQRYYKELTIWKQLNHPNVIPTFGASADIGGLCVVAPWMPEGELLPYLQRYPGANRVWIVRTSLRILADERTEFYIQDAWSGGWASLPPSQRCRSR